MRAARWLGLASLFAATAALHLWGAARGTAFVPALAVHMVATAAWLLIVWTVVRGGWQPRLGVALGLCIALRLLALPVAPALSDDYFRYLHEGHLVAAGINPYLVAPDDCPVERRGAYHKRINNPSIPAAYPPTVQWLLGAAALAQPCAQRAEDPFPWAIKGVFGTCDLLVFVVLWCYLPLLGVPRERALVHGLCPLMVLEFTVEGHSDSVAVLGMVAALYSWQRGWWGRAGGGLAVATAAKYLPAVLLPFMWRRGGLRLLLPFALVVAALYAPFVWSAWLSVEGWAGLFQGTGQYVGRWRSNDSGFALLMALTEWATGGGSGVVTAAWAEGLGLGGMEVQRLVKVPLAVLGFGLIGWMGWRRWPPHAAALGFFVFFVLFAPTVHPWYLGFLVPLLAWWPNPGALLFCGTVYASYHVLPPFLMARDAGVADLGPFWREQWGWKVAEYVPLYAGLLWGALRHVRSRGPGVRH